jgi:hypothetical protein
VHIPLLDTLLRRYVESQVYQGPLDKVINPNWKAVRLPTQITAYSGCQGLYH